MNSALNKIYSKYIGTKEFYYSVIAIAVPLIIQNLITNFVSMLDNIMVGQVGTAQMSGVSIVNQFMFVFNITVFGGVSGASIFGTQFFGKGDSEGQKYTFRFRIFMSIIIIAVFTFIFKFFDKELISLFLSDSENLEIVEATLRYGQEYLSIMIYTLIPFAIGQAYSSVVRECGETVIPMMGSVAAIGVNLFLDYALIFGKFGFPELGVKGAAIATVVAKCIEALVVIVWAHVCTEKNKYIVGLYKSIYIPKKLAIEIIIKGSPLLVNEFIWALGMSVVAQVYSVRGIDVVAARNIASTITNLTSVVFIQLGAVIGIIVGAKLGAGKMEEAIDTDRKLIFFSVVSTIILVVISMPLAWIFPGLYNTEERIRELSTYIIVVSFIFMPVWAYTNAAYFTLRSGGKTGITFLFDFVYTWIIMIPLGYVLIYLTNLNFKYIFFLVTASELIKVVIGHFMIKAQIWVNNVLDKIEA